MSKTAHPFQTAALDEVLDDTPRRAKITASPKAQKAHATLKRKGQIRIGDDQEKPWRKARGAAPPEAPPGPSLNAPTQQRLDKDNILGGLSEGEHDDGTHDDSWDRAKHAGGQTSHKARSFLDQYRDKFDGNEQASASALQDDAEWLDRQRTICSRTYSGAPFMGAADQEGIEGRRSFAIARFRYVLAHLTPGAAAAAAALILAVRRERDGKTTSIKQFAFDVGRYGSKNVAGPFTVGYAKCLLQWIGYLQAQFARGDTQMLEDKAAVERRIAAVRVLTRGEVEREMELKFQTELARLKRLLAEAERKVPKRN